MLQGKEPARRVMPHARRVGIEGIKSYRRHRLVIKDLDGLEPLRVKVRPTYCYSKQHMLSYLMTGEMPERFLSIRAFSSLPPLLARLPID